ncbi:MAG: hypothetical protein K2O24_02940 [Muribaculaceae bacterium]|nr:hypothetical protein [Muribaculaceae bacterium]
MKKLLLLSALALGMATAQADDFSNYFKVSMDGQEVENGATIYVPGGFEEWDENHEFGVYYAGHLHVTGVQPEVRPLYTQMTYDTPSGAEFKSDMNYWGTMQLCFQGGADNPGNCLTGNDYFVGSGTFNVPGSDKDTFVWIIDLNAASPEADVTAKLTMIACNGDANGDWEEIDGAEFNATIVFTQKENAVEGIMAENGETEYYTLQGVRVANPDKGIYLVKKGAKVTKHVF